MKSSSILSEIKNIYQGGGNILQYFRAAEGTTYNKPESILISYDYQAGSYTANYKRNPANYHKYAKQIIGEIERLGSFGSIMEAGVGEATTFKQVISNIALPGEKCFGFDISWSRLKIGKDFLAEDDLFGQQLFVAGLSSIPLADNSIDLVYTSHSIEPNSGNEKPILEELYRVTGNYLVLFEPDYKFASEQAKKRMDEHAYVKNLANVASELGYNVTKWEPLEFSINPLNPTSVIVIKKSGEKVLKQPEFQCPITKTKLLDCGEVFFAPEPGLMYPVIRNIPCLLDTYAILGAKYDYQNRP